MKFIADRSKAQLIIGHSTDTKPTNVDYGAQFYEVDTGKSYTFCADDTTWYDGSPFSAPAAADSGDTDAGDTETA